VEEKEIIHIIVVESVVDTGLQSGANRTPG
jgi:hypothetical protein